MASLPSNSLGALPRLWRLSFALPLHVSNPRKAPCFLHRMSRSQSSLRPITLCTARPPPDPPSCLLSVTLGLPLAAGLRAVPLLHGGTPMRPRSLMLSLLAMLLALGTVLPIPVGADDSSKVTIRCDKNKTITDALAQHQGGPLTVEIIGTCFENVTVRRSGVTLKASAPGAAIQSPDSTRDTLTVTADRFVLDGLMVNGGRNAIVVTGASQAQLRNCTALTNGSGTPGVILDGIGILFSQGASGSVDSCTSSGNRADGIFLDAAIVTITNSRLEKNGRNGVFVFGASTGRIGFSNAFVPGANIISGNGANGIHVTQNSLALIFGN